MYVKQKEFNESIDISVTIAYLDKEQDQLTKKQEQFDPHQLWKQICNNVSIKKYTPIAVTRSTLSLFLIGIHSMQGWTATTGLHGVIRKRST